MQLVTWLQHGNMLMATLLWPKFKIDVFLHRALTGHRNAWIIKAGRLCLSCPALLRKKIIRKAKQHRASEIRCYLMCFLMRQDFTSPPPTHFHAPCLVFARVWQGKIQMRSTHWRATRTQTSKHTRQACHEDYLPRPRGLYKFFKHWIRQGYTLTWVNKTPQSHIHTVTHAQPPGMSPAWRHRHETTGVWSDGVVTSAKRITSDCNWTSSRSV